MREPVSGECALCPAPLLQGLCGNSPRIPKSLPDKAKVVQVHLTAWPAIKL